MELVSGETLAERIKREGALPVEEALTIAKQIAEAFEAAHEKGIIHRDLKPANVKVAPDGKVKVLDFGKEGIAELEKGLPSLSDSVLGISDLAYGYVLAGKGADAQKVLEQVKNLSNRKYVPSVCVATIYAGLNDRDKSFAWLEKRYNDRSIGGLCLFSVDPVFDPVRSDPRFVDLLRRMNLAQ